MTRKTGQATVLHQTISKKQNRLRKTKHGKQPMNRVP